MEKDNQTQTSEYVYFFKNPNNSGTFQSDNAQNSLLSTYRTLCTSHIIQVPWSNREFSKNITNLSLANHISAFDIVTNAIVTHH